jgi:hypothetical protein
VQIKNEKIITNNIKCYSKSNDTFINKNIKIKINKNNNERDAYAQARSAHNKNKNNKYIIIKNEKIMTNDTKCHLETNINSFDKNAKIKICKNENEIYIDTKSYNVNKNNGVKYTKINKNKIIENDTKCHLDNKNITGMNINMKIKLKHNNNNTNTYTKKHSIHSIYSVKNTGYIQAKNNKIRINDIKCDYNISIIYLKNNTNIITSIPNHQQNGRCQQCRQKTGGDPRTKIIKCIPLSQQHPAHRGVSFESKGSCTERENGPLSRVTNSLHESTNNSLPKFSNRYTHTYTTTTTKIGKEALKKDNMQKSQTEKLNCSTNIITGKSTNSGSTVQAKASQKTATGTQKYHNNRIKESGPKRERKASYLTLDTLSKISMETPPLFPSKFITKDPFKQGIQKSFVCLCLK